MSAVEPNWPIALMLALTWLVGCAGLLFVFGHLPLSAAPEGVRRGGGPVLVWLGLAVMVAVALATVVMAFESLRWTTMVVLGGFVFLFAPFFVQDLPAAIRDTQRGLVLVVTLGVVALGAICAVAGAS
jgi:hypothetical protein